MEQQKIRADFFIFAGEESGDQLGDHILQHLKEYRCVGVGGVLMSPQLDECVDSVVNYRWMGFGEVIKKLPVIYKKLQYLTESIIKLNPRVLVCIDFPDFTMQLIKRVKKKGYKGKIIQVVSPQFWAWRKNRKKILEKYLDGLCVLFPFEKYIFDSSPLPCKFIGHPLAHQLLNKSFPDLEKEYVSIFPGSRLREIQHNFPLQLEALKEYCKKNSLIKLAVCSANPQAEKLIRSLANVPITIVTKENRHDLMKQSLFAIATSGTVSLELALLQVPALVTYKLSRFDQWVAQYLLRIQREHFVMANILLEKTVYEEWIGPHCQLKNLYSSVERIACRSCREKQKKELSNLKELFKSKNPGLEAARFLKEALF